VPAFGRGDLRLYYAQRGAPDGPPVVLLHGLLLSSRIMERLAGSLPGYRVLLLDLDGHGKSSRPRDPDRYSLESLADDVVGLLDHLGIDRAVVGGLSLGANVALQTALSHPDRVRALVLEMPVFTRGEPVGRPAFTGLAWLYRLAAPLGDALRPVARRVPLPRSAYEVVAFRDIVVSDHRADAALLTGLLRGDAPSLDAGELGRIMAPTLVIGHGGDPLHVLDDAVEAAERLPDARLVTAATFFDFRFRPGRLATQVEAFLDDVHSRQEGPRRASNRGDHAEGAAGGGGAHGAHGARGVRRPGAGRPGGRAGLRRPHRR
jgi:pimeloyl-ACP methyl ester carboxylesterase